MFLIEWKKDCLAYNKTVQNTVSYLAVVATATVVITAAYEDDYKKDNPFAAVVAKIKTAHESFASFLPSLIVYERSKNRLL